MFITPRGVDVAPSGDVTLHAVHVFGCEAISGGAVWAGAAVLLGEQTRLLFCTAHKGGGVFLQGPGGSLAAKWAVVEGCRATDAGGGVYATLNASIRLEGAAVRGNTAGAHGGGVYIAEGGALVMVGNSAVQDNTVRFCRPVSRADCACGSI